MAILSSQPVRNSASLSSNPVASRLKELTAQGAQTVVATLRKDRNGG